MNRVPRHVAVIPDGNRRWARERGLGAGDGHRAGIARMTVMADTAFDAGVEVFSFWWSSPANLQKRDPDEVADILAALDDWLRREAPSLLIRHGAEFVVLGRHRELCPSLDPALRIATEAAGPGPKKLVLLMAYDGRDEIRAAVAEASAAGEPESFEKRLWTGVLPPVGLVVRTGNATHLSAGFMLWQIAEATLVFVEAMWPAFSEDEFRALLGSGEGGGRRYGR